MQRVSARYLSGVFWLCVMLFMSLSAYALDFSTKVLEVSSSGQTVLLDRRPMYAFTQESEQQASELGILALKERKDDGRVFYRPLARLIRVSPLKNHSVWMITDRYSEQEIRKGQKLWLFSEVELLQGRRGFDVSRQKVILKENAQSASKALPDQAPVRAGKLEKLTHHYTNEQRVNGDAQVVDLDVWEKHAYEEDRVRPASLYRSERLGKFKRSLRVRQFEHIVSELLLKYNDPSFDLKGFYASQGRKQGLDTRPLGGNFYDRAQERNALEEEEKQRLKTEITSKGARWSQDYSDEELAQLVREVGVISEESRRENLARPSYEFQFYADFSYGLLENRNLGDSSASSLIPFGLSAALEWHLFRRLEGFERLTLEGGVMRAQDVVSLQGFNSTTQQMRFSVGVNWHPWRPADSLEQSIIYVGTHLGYGQAQVKAHAIGESAIYQAFSFPELRLGYKYNFANQWGMRAAFNYANVSLDRSSGAQSSPNLPSSKNFAEGRFAVALSRYF